MGDLLDRAAAVLAGDTWTFERPPGQNALALVVDGPPRWTLVVTADDEDQVLTVYGVLGAPIAEPHRVTALERLNRENFGVEVTSFELDGTDGELRCRGSILVAGEPLVEAQLRMLMVRTVAAAVHGFPEFIDLLDDKAA